MTKKDTYKKYSSEVSRINILLENFHYFHSASNEDDIDPKYHPNERLLNKLKDWLSNNNARSAIYLITGYRGAGKTSFVSYTIKMLNKECKKKKRYIPISISLGHDNLQEIEILHIITKNLLNIIEEKSSVIVLYVLRLILQMIIGLLLFTTAILIIGKIFSGNKINIINSIITDKYAIETLCNNLHISTFIPIVLAFLCYIIKVLYLDNTSVNFYR